MKMTRRAIGWTPRRLPALAVQGVPTSNLDQICSLRGGATPATTQSAFSSLALLAFVLIRSVFLGSVATSTSSTKNVEQKLAGPPPQNNPLWPGGIDSQDVDDLVNACLKDPTINIGSIPDYLERQIYRSTIQLTLDALYQALAGVHGHELLGHEFRLIKLSRRKARIQNELSRLSETAQAQEEVLEQVVNRLLANKNINQPLIPDVLERQLYTNCLKIVFRVLDLLAVSFRLTLCGHDLRLQFEPSTRIAIKEAALTRAMSSNTLSNINMEHMKEISRELASETDQQRWFWQRWMSPADNDFMAQIHATVYCLILGILDDFLENTEIQLLSDRIRFDLVPAGESSDDDGEEALSVSPLVVEAEPSKKTQKPHRIVTLVTGMGLGAALKPIVDKLWPLALAAVSSKTNFNFDFDCLAEPKVESPLEKIPSLEQTDAEMRSDEKVEIKQEEFDFWKEI